MSSHWAFPATSNHHLGYSRLSFLVAFLRDMALNNGNLTTTLATTLSLTVGALVTLPSSEFIWRHDVSVSHSDK